MKKMTKKFLFSLTCIMLVCIMVFMSACKVNKDTPVKNNSISIIEDENLPEDKKNNSNIDDTSGSEKEINDGEDENIDIVKPPLPDETVLESYELNKAENFVYSLIYSDLQKEYDTFTACITLPKDSNDGEEPEEIYGISYVDYEEGYIDEFGKTYFSAGFISFPNNASVDSVDEISGLEITSLEEDYNELYSYINAYFTEDVHMHCVIDNKYVKYDIVNGEIKYEEEPYFEEMPVDYNRGNIYNYDIEEYVYIVEEQDYVSVSGVSLIGEADYQDVIEEVNKILKTQEFNLSYAEVESYVSKSQDAIYSYLLGLQEESFMGIPVNDLLEIVKNLNPMEHLRIGIDENGATTIEIIEVTKLATLWEKIATSIVCACGVVCGVICNVVGNIIPVTKLFLGPLGGALIGASMEAFSQVVINNTPISDIQWAQVGVAAVSGAIAGVIGIGLQGVGNILVREVVDTLCDGIIGGAEFFANSLIAGESLGDACKNFGYGVVAGVVISGGVKIASKVIKSGIKIVKQPKNKIINDINGIKLTKLSNEATEGAVSETQEKTLKKTAKNGANNSVKNLKPDYDDNKKLYRIGDNLVSNEEYTLRGYKFVTDKNGRIKSVSGNLFEFKGKRLSILDSMNSIGKGDQLITDQRGHIIAYRFSGLRDLGNLVPQNARLNQGEYRKLENLWAKALKNGKNVYVEISLDYAGELFRPNSFFIKYEIDGIIKEVKFIN